MATPSAAQLHVPLLFPDLHAAGRVLCMTCSAPGPCHSDGWLLLFPEPGSDTSQAQLMRGERTWYTVHAATMGEAPHAWSAVKFLVLQVPAHWQ